MSWRIDRDGMHGSIIVSDTDTDHKGPFCKIKMIDVVQFTTLTDSAGTIAGDTGDTIATFTFPAQYEYYGWVTTFRCKSGRVQAYYAEDKS
jgi:hypothetical protein